MKRLIRTLRESPLFYAWIAVLAVCIVIGLVGGIQVLIYGLDITGLSDGVPWGMWITLDLSATASGGGAFILSAFIYSFGMKRYGSVLRVAVLTGFLGYTSALMALFMDIGQPVRAWHPLFYWNLYSPLWGVSMGVVIYATVLAVEMLPVLLGIRYLAERETAHRISDLLHKLAAPLAALGLVVTLLYQSAVGATYGSLVGRAVWFSSAASAVFLSSAAATGLAITTAAAAVVGWLQPKKSIKPEVLRSLATMAGIAILTYLYLKLWDWVTLSYYAGHFSSERVAGVDLLRTNTPYQTTFWLGEVLLGAVVPAAIYLIPRMRERNGALALAGALTFIGVVIHRWNATLSGTIVPMDWSPGVGLIFPMATYSPSPIELMVATGIVGYWLMGFTLAVKYLPIFPERQEGVDEDTQIGSDAAVQMAATGD